jgi:hypothetical protein
MLFMHTNSKGNLYLEFEVYSPQSMQYRDSPPHGESSPSVKCCDAVVVVTFHIRANKETSVQ